MADGDEANGGGGGGGGGVAASAPLFRAKGRTGVSRTGPASLPLLQRAGLGPDVLRAFDAGDDVGVGRSTAPPPPQPPQPQPPQPSPPLTTTTAEQPTPLAAAAAAAAAPEGVATSQGTPAREDSDSGLGPSSDGGSQFLVGLEKLADAWKVPHSSLLFTLLFSFVSHLLLVGSKDSFSSTFKPMATTALIFFGLITRNCGG